MGITLVLLVSGSKNIKFCLLHFRLRYNSLVSRFLKTDLSSEIITCEERKYCIHLEICLASFISKIILYHVERMMYVEILFNSWLNF